MWIDVGDGAGADDGKVREDDVEPGAGIGDDADADPDADADADAGVDADADVDADPDTDEVEPGDVPRIDLLSMAKIELARFCGGAAVRTFPNDLDKTEGSAVD